MIAPTIIIGLGGIGSDICCRVSKMVKDDRQRKRIRFVCIDTDINDLSRRRDEDPRIITIQTSAPYTVGDYLETNTRAKNDWFPNHNILMHKTPTEGAGQVRAISRLAFEEAVKEGRLAALNKAVEELYYLDGAAEQQAIRVLVVSTLAGGTGSGIVLPVALYVRNFLETRFRKSASIMRGFFLLPEIMFGNKSPEECGSLCCNAYASMRELDAFMRRGDGALPMPRYKNLRLELPDASSGSYVDYSVSPFNFCFLYDKRNTDDLQLKSFDDYKEHAANTIYTQTISGISSRSNSNEDNTIKPLVKSNGRNRFCGAGSSLLKYPRDSVLRYIAGKWCIQVMGDEWLSIDKLYAKYLKDQKILRKKNPNLKDESLADFYVDQINRGAEGSFAEQMFSMCHLSVEDDLGNVASISKLDKYTSALEQYIRDEINKDPDLEDLEVSYSVQFSKLSNVVSGNSDGEEEVKRKEIADEMRVLMGQGTAYVNMCKALGNRLGRTISSSMFGDDQDYTNANAPYRIEYYMKDEDGKFIHPSAARYFIYSLLKSFTEGANAASENLVSMLRLVDVFDDPRTPAIEGGDAAVDSAEKSLNSRFGKKTRLEFLGKSRKQHENAYNYAVELAKKGIYEAGILYLKKLSEAYEKFYTNFETYLKGTYSEVAEIERKYVNGEGKATRYVCASQKCLRGMLEEMPCSGGNISVNGDLSASIYNEMRKYSMMVKQPNASMYFRDLYENQIIGFWEDLVLDNHAAKIDMDVLTALEAEADYEKDEAMTEEQRSRYVAQILQQAERLAAPFVEEPMGEIRHPFTICAYNSEVAGIPDSSRRSFVKKYLNDMMGGQVDDNVSPYELMIYKAIYNLSAGDLKRFNAPKDENGVGGVYYNSYIETIKNLGPNSDQNSVLTPHIDRRWHLTKYMPDLNDENQNILEDDIYSALLWGMVTGKIKQHVVKSNTGDEEELRYTPKSKNAKAFIVSNGTSCDNLYEVLDALEINPPIVNEILDDMRDNIQKEKQSKMPLSETKLLRCLHWTDRSVVFFDEADVEEEDPATLFVIREYAEDKKAGIFDLLYWIKESMPANELDDEMLSTMLESILETFEHYVGQFVGADTKYDRCYVLLLDQFSQFIDNLKTSGRPDIERRMQSQTLELFSNIMIERSDKVYNQPDRKAQLFDILLERGRSEVKA